MIHKSFLGTAIFKKYVEPGESVLFIAHQHGIVLYWDVLQMLVFAIGLPMFIVSSNPELYPVAILIALFFGLRFLNKFALWFFDCWVFTDRGIIDIRWKSIFKRDTINVDYRHTEGISVRVRGFWQTIFRMGDMTLDRDSTTAIMNLHNAAHPNKVQDRYMAAKAQALIGSNTMGSSTAKIKDILSEMIRDYAEQKGISVHDD